MRHIWFMVLAILLVSCATTPTNSVDSTLQPVDNQQAGYPAAKEINLTGYPAPQGFNTNIIPIPDVTKDPSMGFLKGRLLENGKPVEYADLYLAELLTNEDGMEVAFAFDYNTSPRTQSDKDGKFEFVNLSAGEYGLVYDVVTETVLLLDPKTGEQLKVVIVPGTEVDAGDLDYTELPEG